MVEVIGRAKVIVESDVDTNSVGRIGSTFQKALVPSIAALGALGAASIKAIDSASDLAEQVSKSGVVFEGQADSIRKFADGAAESLGLSSRAALEATSNFGILAQGAGLSGKDAANFSKQFTTLAADLASFSNTSTDEAITAIGAALRGESEPIRKYGVLLDDATLKAKALALGIADGTSTLTPQQRALAASKVILEQTTKAQGDYARTAESAANQNRTLQAETENLSAKLGDRLLPFYVKLQEAALAALDWMSRHQTVVAVLAIVVGSLAAAVLAVNGAMALLALNPITLVIAAIVAAVALLVAGFVLLYKRSETLRTAVGNLGDKFMEFWEEHVQPAFDKIKKKFEELKPKFDEIGDSLAVIIDAIDGPLLKALGKFADYMGGEFTRKLGLAKVVLGTIGAGLKQIADGIKAIDKAISDAKNGDSSGFADMLGNMLIDGFVPNAQGTRNWKGGWTLVGEEGPELVNLPQGSDIYSNPESRAMAAGGGTTIINLNGPSSLSAARVEQTVANVYGTRFGA